MKRIINLCLVSILLAGGACLSAFAQTPAAPEPSLGDYARNVKKDKKTVAKTFDNDNIPMQDTLSVVGPSPRPELTPPKSTSTRTRNRSLPGSRPMIVKRSSINGRTNSATSNRSSSC